MSEYRQLWRKLTISSYQKLKIVLILLLRYSFSAIFTKHLEDINVEFGSDVKLECVFSDPTADSTWYKNGVMLQNCMANKNGGQHVLCFPSIAHVDAGKYECRCGNESSKSKVQVKGTYIYLSD